MYMPKKSYQFTVKIRTWFAFRRIHKFYIDAHNGQWVYPDFVYMSLSIYRYLFLHPAIFGSTRIAQYRRDDMSFYSI